MTVFSPSLFPPMALKVGLTSASATSSENDDDDNSEEGGGEEESSTTDAMTDEEEEVVDDNGGADVQQEDNTEQEQQPPSSSTQEQEADDEEEGQQFATVVGEICDDFEDNDGDGLIDSADADCAAPLTEGTVMAPTTPPPPSVVNTTATNSTANTLTGSGIAGLDRPYDLQKDCKTYEQLGIPDPPLSPGDPPDVQWYDCGGVGVRVPPPVDTTTTANSGTGEGQGLAQGGGVQGGQQPPSSSAATPPSPFTTRPQEPQQQQEVEICNDGVDNDGNGLIDSADVEDCAPLPLPPPAPPTFTTPQEQQQQEPGDEAAAAGTISSSTTTDSDSDSDTGGERREICDDFEDNDGDGLIDSADADCAAPLTEGTVTTSAPTTTIDRYDGSITTTYPDGIEVRNYPNGIEVRNYPDGTSIITNGVPADQRDDDIIPRPPKHIPGVIHTKYPDQTTIVEYPQGTLEIGIPGFGTAYIYPDGTSMLFGVGSGGIYGRFQPADTEMLVFLILVHLQS